VEDVFREGVVMEDVSAVVSFESFVRSEYRDVRALVIALHGGRDPDDVVQEAFLRAQKHWSELAGRDRPELWVRRVALNLAVSRLRRWGRESKALLRLAARREVTVVVLSAGAAEVWEQVRRLPSRQGQAIALRYLDGLSIAEVAVILGVAEGTVRALLHQGRTRLARVLDVGVEVSVEEELR
jgi:RNA polymerase sigma-70 factor, ECF subfamily